MNKKLLLTGSVLSALVLGGCVSTQENIETSKEVQSDVESTKVVDVTETEVVENDTVESDSNEVVNSDEKSDTESSEDEDETDTDDTNDESEQTSIESMEKTVDFTIEYEHGPLNGTMVLDGDIIKSIDIIDPKPGAQENFANAVGDVVVGKSIDGLDIDTIGGASYVSEAFEDVLEEIAENN